MSDGGGVIIGRAGVKIRDRTIKVVSGKVDGLQGGDKGQPWRNGVHEVVVSHIEGLEVLQVDHFGWERASELVVLEPEAQHAGGRDQLIRDVATQHVAIQADIHQRGKLTESGGNGACQVIGGEVNVCQLAQARQ